MNKQVKRKWVNALRSGKYEQGPGNLHDPDAGCHCCLGVLRHVVVGRNRGRVMNYRCEELSDNFIQEVGLTREQHDKLVGYNDGFDNDIGNDGISAHQRSFKWIASYIERYL